MSSFEFSEATTWGSRPVARRIADTSPRQRLVVTGTIVGRRITAVGHAPAAAYRLDDGTGAIELIFVGRVEVGGLHNGTRCTIEGTAQENNGHLVTWNPRYRIEPPQDEAGTPAQLF